MRRLSIALNNIIILIIDSIVNYQAKYAVIQS